MNPSLSWFSLVNLLTAFTILWFDSTVLCLGLLCLEVSGLVTRETLRIYAKVNDNNYADKYFIPVLTVEVLRCCLLQLNLSLVS